MSNPERKWPVATWSVAILAVPVLYVLTLPVITAIVLKMKWVHGSTRTPPVPSNEWRAQRPPPRWLQVYSKPYYWLGHHTPFLSLEEYSTWWWITLEEK